MTTIKDVANEAGVSVATASRAIRDVGYISEENKIKVLKAAKALGYTPNLNAKTLRSGKSNVIGVIVSDLGNYFYNIVLSKIEQELKRLGYIMLLSYSNEDTDEEAQNISLMLHARVDGILFTPVSAVNSKLMQNLKKQGIPALQLYRNAYHDFDSVVVDDEIGAYLATRHLLSRGHKKIMLLGVDSDISPNRTNGYRRALFEFGMEADSSYIAECPLHQNIRDTIRKHIKERKPTAIVAGTNTFGYDTVMVCKEEKLDIPGDISLVVFDDVSWVSLCDMTVIWQPVDGIASSAVQTLMNKIRIAEEDKSALYRGKPTNIKIEPSLIERASVKTIK